MKRLAQSLFIITVLALATLRLSSAFFSDTETSSGNLLQAGKIDLLINDTNNPETVVDLQDLKPGDERIVPKIIEVDDNDAWVWMHLVSYASSQGISTEPENEEEANVWGGPKHDIENYIYYDLGFEGADPQIISLANQVRFPDAFSCWIPLGEIEGGVPYTLNQSFHFDADVTNWAQGDELSFIEEFYAVQSRNNPNPVPPVSESGRVWNPDTRRCEDGSNLLWIIGDEEESQLDNPADEFNFVGLGQYPNPANYNTPFLRTIASPVDNPADLLFPWNSDFSVNYGRTINIEFNVASGPIDTVLTLRWSPGASGTENKSVYLDNVLVGTIGPISGVSDPLWWSNYPMREDTFSLNGLSNGLHTIRLEQTTGNGTVWDFIKLEKQ